MPESDRVLALDLPDLGEGHPAVHLPCSKLSEELACELVQVHRAGQRGVLGSQDLLAGLHIGIQIGPRQPTRCAANVVGHAHDAGQSGGEPDAGEDAAIAPERMDAHRAGYFLQPDAECEAPVNQ